MSNVEHEIRTRIKELQQERRNGGDRVAIGAELNRQRELLDAAWRESVGLPARSF